jgi:hypothetical protein
LHERVFLIDSRKNNSFHAQSIRRRLNGYNLGIVIDLDHTTGSKHLGAGSIVSTKVFDFDIANLLAPDGLDSRNYCRAVSRN